MFILATVGINVVANFVSPAYDLSNAMPKHIDFRRGGLISAVLALLVMPWKLYSSPVAVNYFLGALGAFLGPLFGIIMVDFFLIRRQRVNMEDLYKEQGGSYHYWHGWNPLALAAFVPAALIAAVIALDGYFSAASDFSWFIGAAPAALIYYFIARNRILVGSGDVALPVEEPVATPHAA